jgi:hypothetical protein
MEKHLIFIPCCKSKHATGLSTPIQKILKKDIIPQNWEHLQAGRRDMESIIDVSSPKTTALYLYKGFFYSNFKRQYSTIIDHINNGNLQLYIISAGYGVINALESIHDYDAVLSGTVAKHWRNHGLENIIAEIIQNEQPSSIHGFFAGTSYWSSPGSKYRYFFTEGLQRAKNTIETSTAGCFYRYDGRGVSAIMGSLGRTLADFTQHKFNTDFTKGIEKNHRIDGNIEIGFENSNNHAIIT